MSVFDIWMAHIMQERGDHNSALVYINRARKETQDADIRASGCIPPEAEKHGDKPRT